MYISLVSWQVGFVFPVYTSTRSYICPSLDALPTGTLTWTGDMLFGVTCLIQLYYFIIFIHVTNTAYNGGGVVVSYG